ncbi:MAG: hypothetical protein M3428_04540 [Pseudomonadota bacterium]|nr:hypothetical protein [Pseudomonadota bacterium]
MDNINSETAPRWFGAAAIAALLWEIFGCATYVLNVTGNQSSLPAEQAAMWAATPAWSVGAYAVAVWVGLVGAALLVMRRRLAEPLLLVSLIAVLVQFSAHLLVPELRDITPPGALIMPLFIIIVCLAIWLLARRAKRHGWLR